MTSKNYKCTAFDCDKRKHPARPFCEDCFGNLPSNLKTRISGALRAGNGVDLMNANKEAREYLKGTHNQWKEKAMNEHKESVTIALDLLEERERSYKVTDGEIVGMYNSPRWIFLPKSQCKNNNDGTFTMPEWLAKEKDLA